MIRIRRLVPHQFKWYWHRDAKVLLVGLWWFTIGLDFGLKKSRWYRHFFRDCPVCEKPLNVLHRFQVVKWHKECRREGRRMERKGLISLQSGT